MLSGLRRRLLVMLISPLILLALLNAWFDYRSADNVALQQDQRLLALMPLLADSVIGEGLRNADPPVLLMAPAVEESSRPAPATRATPSSIPTARSCTASPGWAGWPRPRASRSSTARSTAASPGAS